MQDKNYNIRYAMEHSIFPELLFDNPKKTIICLSHPTLNYYYDLLDALYEENGMKNPYKVEDFKIERFSYEDVLIAVINLPEPEQGPLCRRLYILFDKKFSKVKYFTIEKSANLFGEISKEDNSDISFLCGWDKKKRHNNYGPIVPNTIESEREKVLASFKKKPLLFSFH